MRQALPDPGTWIQDRGSRINYLVPSTRYQVLGTRFVVPSTCYRVLGTKYLVQVPTKYLVPSTWYQVPGTQYLVPSTGCQVLDPRSWIQVPGFASLPQGKCLPLTAACRLPQAVTFLYQVPGTRYLVPSTWYQGLGTGRLLLAASGKLR